MKPVAVVALLLLFAQDVPPPWSPFGDDLAVRHDEVVSAYDYSHYDVDLVVDDEAGTLEGTCRIEGRYGTESSTLKLHAEGMEILSATVSDVKVVPERRDGLLVLPLEDRPRGGDPIRATIAYRTKPQAGWTFVQPDAGYPDRPRVSWTQGETTYNRHWFPCWDEPSDRATWQISLTVREKYQTVSNGARVGSGAAKGRPGWRRDSWKIETPMPTYLASVVVGELDSVSDSVEVGGRKVVLGAHAPRGWHSEAEIRRTFARTAKMVEFFSSKTGVPYAWGKYDQVVVPEFTWGGMENVTATTLHPGTVVPKRQWGERDSDGLIAHELAHQWFGDMVTCRTWAHIWLNEGFATYFGALWSEQVGGAEGLAGDLLGGLEGYLGECRRYQRPVVCAHYSSPDDVFDSHAYPRGAWVLHMLRRRLGDEAWWKGIRRYLEKHAYQSVTTDQLRIAMEEASGQDLRAFFRQWTEAVGHPELKVTKSWDAAAKRLKLTVRQVQPIRKLEYKDLKTERPVFEFPLDVEVETAAGRTLHRLEVKKVEEVYELDCPEAPLFLDVDRDLSVLMSLDADWPVAELVEMLKRDDQPWWRAWAAKRLAGKPEAVGPIWEILRQKPTGLVGAACIDALAETASPNSMTTLLAVLGDLDRMLPGIRERVAAGLDTAEDRDRVRMRASALGALWRYAAQEPVKKTLAAALESWDWPSAQAAAAEALGGSGAGAFELLAKAATTYSKDDLVLPGVLAGLLKAEDPRAVPVFVEHAAYGRHPQVRRKAADALAELLGKLKAAGSEDEKGWAALLDLVEDPSFRIRRLAVAKLGDLGDESAIPRLEARAGKETDRRLVKAIRDAVRRIRTAK